MTLLFYFIIGVAIDVVIAIGWYALEKRWIMLSVASTMAQTIIAVTVYYNMFFSGDFTIEAVAFTMGCGLGTGLIVAYNKYWRGRKKWK